jgi:hypothetical protein
MTPIEPTLSTARFAFARLDAMGDDGLGGHGRGQAGDSMATNDPLRNIRTVFGGNITLFKNPEDGPWLMPPFHVRQISFFVDCNGKIRLIMPSLLKPTLSMQILDALHEID